MFSLCSNIIWTWIDYINELLTIACKMRKTKRDFKERKPKEISGTQPPVLWLIMHLIYFLRKKRNSRPTQRTISLGQPIFRFSQIHVGPDKEISTYFSS